MAATEEPTPGEADEPMAPNPSEASGQPDESMDSKPAEKPGPGEPQADEPMDQKVEEPKEPQQDEAEAPAQAPEAAKPAEPVDLLDEEEPAKAHDDELIVDWGSHAAAAAAPKAATAAPKTTASPKAVAAQAPVASVELDGEGDVLDVDDVAATPVAEKTKEVAAPAAAPMAPSAPAVAVLELDSDDEEQAPYKEMELRAGLLDEEFAEEEEKAVEGERRPEPQPDPERLPRDEGPYPSLPPFGNVEPSDARRKVLAKVKQQAGEALVAGDVPKALERYTEAIRTGGATALMLATRAALLLKQRRPCAAIRDCCAALQLNPDCGKAHHVRGVAHRKLGHWKKAHRDLSQGQRLDFSEESVNVHMFVASKVGVMQDQKTGRWYQAEGAKKAVELLFTAEGQRKKSMVDLRAGQAVRISGLQSAAGKQLNGKRGIVQRPNPTDPSRWEVELRVDRGKLETKSIKGENIAVVRAADAAAWKEEEAVHAEERKRREREEKRWQDEEDRRKRMEKQRKASEWSLRADGFPDMEPSERLEAEMSTMPLDEEAMGLLRRLRAEEALDVLQQVSLGGIGSLCDFIRMKVRQKLGETTDADEEAARRKAKAAATPPPQAAPATAPPAATSTPSAAPQPEPEEDADDGSSSDEDFDRLPEDAGPMPDAGYTESDPTEEQAEAQARWKAEAAEALTAGDQKLALARYTKVISCGGSTALMLTKRSELLLKMARPNAAIADCTAALAMNPDLGKAYRVRGIAHRKLGHWVEAKSDLAEGQRLDFDDGTAAVEKFVSEKVRVSEVKAARKRRLDAGGAPGAKRAKA